jgi:hypothetical protein
MEDSNPSPESELLSTRRTILAALAATFVVSGCKTPSPTSGPAVTPKTKPLTTPVRCDLYPDQPSQNPDAIQATLALWILLTSSEQFFKITEDNTTYHQTTSEQCAEVKAEIVKNLNRLVPDPETVIDNFLTYVDSQTFTAYAKVDLTGHPIQEVHLPYSSALKGARSLFYLYATGQTLQNYIASSPAPYTKGDPHCPELESVLAIAPPK